MTATQAVFLKQNWPGIGSLQRELLIREGVDLAGYRLLGETRVKRAQVIHGRTDQLWLNTIISPEMTITAYGPLFVRDPDGVERRAVRGEATS